MCKNVGIADSANSESNARTHTHTHTYTHTYTHTQTRTNKGGEGWASRSGDYGYNTAFGDFGKDWFWRCSEIV